MKLADLNLPIQDHARPILEAVRGSQVLIIEGATGSGKTTLLPYLMYRGGFAKKGKIACVLPTRPGAVLASEFVAELLQDSRADIVGHQVRGSRAVSHETKIVYMTEGVLVHAIRQNTHLSRYSLIILDEVHERKVNYDFLLGYLKGLLAIRPDLKLILSSATMRTAELSKFFDNAPVYSIPGRSYPVEVRYSPLKPRAIETGGYLKQMAQLVKEIYAGSGAGHCLVFLPGAADIENMMRIVNDLNLPNIECIPFHGRLEKEERTRVFEYTTNRKVILATNIAETSVTIDGVTHVIDSGIAREGGFIPATGVKSLYVQQITQAAAKQRAGRAGRTAPGVCYRMYTEDSFSARPEYPAPHIKRENLVDLVFLLIELGVTHPEKLDLPTPITPLQADTAIKQLQSWGIIDDARALTPIGKKVGWVGGVSVQMGRMLLLAAEAGIGTEAAEVAAYLSILNFNSEGSGEFRLGGKHQQYSDERGDPITFLRMLRGYTEHRGNVQWCFMQGLDIRVLEEALLLRDEIVENLESFGYRCQGQQQNLDKVHRALVGVWGGTLCINQRSTRYRTGNLMNIKHNPLDRKKSGFPIYVVAFGLFNLDGIVRTTNTIAVPPDMVNEMISVYGDPSVVVQTPPDGKTLKAVGTLRIESATETRVVRIDLNCARSPDRTLSLVSGRTIIAEESNVPVRWLRLSEDTQIALARKSIMTLAACPKTYGALYDSGLTELVCEEVCRALTKLGYITAKPPCAPKPALAPAEPVIDDAQEFVCDGHVDDDDDWLVKDLFGQPISALGLSALTAVRLIGSGIKTVQELVDVPRSKLLNLCGAQESSADEVIDRLEEFGISLATVGDMRQMQRMLEGPEETTMELKFTEEEARKHLGDDEYFRFLRYRNAKNAQERIVARNEIIVANAGLLGYNVKRFLGILARAFDKAIDEFDLMQEGVFGLMTAIVKFEPRSGFRFSTYAVNWIRQAMTRMIQNQGIIRLPVHVHEEINRYEKWRLAFVKKQGRESLPEESAQALKTSLERIAFLDEVRRLRGALSLDLTYGDDDEPFTIMSTLASKTPSPEDEILRLNGDARTKKILDEVLSSLGVPIKSMGIFRMRLGLDDGESKTLEEVGNILGFTRERARQYESAVYEALEDPAVKERLARAAPWAKYVDELDEIEDDQTESLVVNEEVLFEKRPEVQMMRIKDAKIRRALDEALASLKLTERAIKTFKLRHPYHGERPLEFDRIAQKLEVTEEWARMMYGTVIKALYTTEVWEKIKRVAPSTPQPRPVAVVFESFKETNTLKLSVFGSAKESLAQQVIGAVALQADMTVEEMLAHSRQRDVVQARQLAAVILRDHLSISFPEIARHLRYREHSNAMHNYEQGKRLFGNVVLDHETMEVTHAN